MITSKQKALLHVAQAKLNLSRENYEAILHAGAGVRSSNDLDQDGFDQVMRRFEELGFHNTARRRRSAPAPDAMVTRDQLDLIQTLFESIGWRERERQAGFCRRQIKRSWPQTRSQANKVIEGLKAIQKRAGGLK